MLNFGNLSDDLFKRWYIDGRIYYHVVVDEVPLCAEGCGPMILKQGTKEGKEYRGWVCPRPKSGHPANTVSGMTYKYIIVG